MPLPPALTTDKSINVFSGTSLVRPVTPGHKIHVKRGVELFENNDYPNEWCDFIGQEDAKAQLTVAISSAVQRGTRMDHTLLASGIAGVGKSTLATMIAHHMSAGAVFVSGIVELDKARAILRAMRDGDCLIWDEFHLAVSGGKSKAEWLLPYMTEGMLYTDEGHVEVPDVTIIAATTDAGRLPQTILNRFMKRPRFIHYSDAEGVEIARQLTDRMEVWVPESGFRQTMESIARAASNNPRDMRSILTHLRDLNTARPSDNGNVATAIEWAGFSPDGLSQNARDMLVVLLHHNMTASIDTIKAVLNEPASLRHDEQQLLQRGLIAITGRGRKLTEAGIGRATEEMVNRA